ncbi:hypothetical protein Rxyl_2267 [Rubrobacter xylanophilus DSM 9941]|uniref:Uncharacterized protein n=1 Tax=Rubrobacter xylanophilus (strain DSM 9941 / JCM 11954 / NBRC 16129 / PRD-1) TaxID=266117 RepID=Q1ATT1_RUBXD|nr:helix-turn-helix domain-containing protein [Rubrobacter xylanophilus]ABG05197.1 hypothetical protein Rxyl_2267 [Rubrobacter xylanophilus DSM 9941]
MTGDREGRGPAIERVLGALTVAGGPDGKGEYLAFCPAHNDRNTPNLRVREAEDGRVLLRCFAGCDQDEVLSALAERGIGTADLFAKNGSGRRGGAVATPRAVHACTLASYAEAKGLPVSFLRQIGVSDARYAGQHAVRIPYLAEDGTECATRFRIALERGPKGGDRFRWRKGSRPSLYGLWRIPHARETGYAFLVEGESDCHTLWYHGLPALGVPGASAWRNEWAERLEGVGKVYAVVEPDAGGEAFWERLAASPLRERLYRVELKSTKDTSELYLKDPEGFGERMDLARSRAASWLDLAESEERERAREAWAACEELAQDPDILERFAGELSSSGVAGEMRAAKLLYLALTSRLLEKPVSVAVKGPSSGGKTYLVERVLDFFPGSAYHVLTAMSERALAYSEEPIEHRFLVVYEAEGMAGEFATYLMRSLLSEGRLRYEMVERTSEGLRPRLIERQGPTGLIVTTTAVKLHPENETRLLSLTITDTREQTRDVLAALAEEEKGEPDLIPWLALQEWLGSAVHQATIPYAKDLARMVPPVAVRLRRDFGAVLNLIRAHAILHQASRERSAEGKVVATLDDYASVRRLVADLVSDGIEATVPKGVREAVHAVARLHAVRSEPATVAEVARELKLDRSAASRRVRAAKERGYLRDLEDNPRKPSRLVPGEALPEDLEILPQPDALKACKRAGETEGIETPLPSTDGGQADGGGGTPYPSGDGARLHAHGVAEAARVGRERFTL